MPEWSPMPDWKPKRRAMVDPKDSVVYSAIGTEWQLAGFALCEALDIGPGTIYPSLARLERDGFIESCWAEEPEPRRRLYRRKADRLVPPPVVEKPPA